MVLRDADWKTQDSTVLDWSLLVAGVLLLGLNVQRYLTADRFTNGGLAVVWTVWLLLYFTAYWQPILSLAVAVLQGIGTTFLALDGDLFRTPVLLAIGLTVLFFSLAILVFFVDEPSLTPSQQAR